MAPDPGDAELHAVIADRVREVRAKDVEGLLSSYATDVATFDLVVPLANRGVEKVRKRLVIHPHSSVPFDMVSGEAQPGLQP